MHRTYGDGYVEVGGKRLYADENLGSGRDATQVRHEEMNAFQEEIASVIEAEGLTLNAPSEPIASMDQMNTAINNKLKSSRVTNQSVVPGANITAALDNLQAAISANTPRGYIDGYAQADDSSVFSRVKFGQGVARDSTDSLVIERNSGGDFFKTINSAWAQGHDNGGFGGNDGGPNADNWYYTFVLYKVGQPVDYGFDNDPSGANLLAASTYTHLRRVGAVYWTGTKVREFAQKGDLFLHYTDSLSETIQLNNDGGGFNAGTLKCFPDLIDTDIVNVIFGLSAPENNDGGSGVYATIYPQSMSSGFTKTGAPDCFDAANDGDGIKHSRPQKICPCPGVTNLFGKAMILLQQATSIDCTITYHCYGWEDKRGKNA
jgi:hypothetical protein